MWHHNAGLEEKLSSWQQWLRQPQRLWLHNALFRIHFWLGAMAATYLILMSVTGTVLVYYNQLVRWPGIAWLADLHGNLLAGQAGRVVNGIGGISLTLLCLTGAVIWWPGVKNWRRSLRVEWGARFPRINWDLHSVIGFWCLPFVLLWGVSAIYFAFPRWFDVLLTFDPGDRFTDRALSRLSQLHFGRFSPVSEALWAVLGLTPALLAFTGVFICCRRVIYKKPSSPFQ